MTKEEAKQNIIELLEKAINLTPKKLEKDLPPKEDFPEVPSWHDYEHEIWDLGEQIRQIQSEHKSLRKDESLTEKIVEFCENRNAKRGRESFVMLLGYKHNAKYAERLIALLKDRSVCGHVISCLLKMRAPNYAEEIRPYTNDKKIWIRNQAKKYIEKTEHKQL